MKIFQVILKDYQVKVLQSLDKSLKLTFYANLPDDTDISELTEYMNEPLILTIDKDIDLNQ